MAVLIPSRRQVRMMRTATSPRLAIRILSNMGRVLAGICRPVICYAGGVNRRDLLLGAGALAGCTPVASAPPPAFPIRRGINLGNALEAPNEGEWGYRIEFA